MSIKSALRDLLSVPYGMISILVISRCAAPPYPAAPDFPPKGETTHYDLCVAGAPANHVRCASLRSGGRRLAVRKTIEYQIGALPRTPFPAAREFPSRGNEKYGEEKQRVIYFMYYSAVSPFGGERSEPITSMLIMPYDTKANPVTLTL